MGTVWAQPAIGAAPLPHPSPGGFARQIAHVEKFIRFVVSDSIRFLKSYPGWFDALYLDSYEYIGSEEDREKSRIHHLGEIEAALPKLHARSIVMIDDCRPPDGTLGRGALAIPWLQHRGWQVDSSGYQVILVKA